MKTIGIIGGMGALASVDLYNKITKLSNAKCDQDHIHLIIDSNAKLPDRVSFILGKSKDDPSKGLIKSAKMLKNAGCDAIALACNTAHYFIKDIQSEVDIEILHIADIASKAIKKNFKNAKRVALLCTTATKKAKIYDEFIANEGLELLNLDDQIMASVMDCIYKGVKANKIEEYAEIFNDVVSKIDADVFIAGCTEIPILLPFLKTKQDRFIDATKELAKFIINFAKS